MEWEKSWTFPYVPLGGGDAYTNDFTNNFTKIRSMRKKCIFIITLNPRSDKCNSRIWQWECIGIRITRRNVQRKWIYIEGRYWFSSSLYEMEDQVEPTLVHSSGRNDIAVVRRPPDWAPSETSVLDSSHDNPISMGELGIPFQQLLTSV